MGSRAGVSPQSTQGQHTTPPVAFGGLGTMSVVTREETGAQRAQVAEGRQNNRAGLFAQAQGGRPVPPRSTAACPGLQQGPRPLHHGVALLAPGSPGPPPSSPVLRLGMMKPKQLRGGGAEQWLRGGCGPPGDPRQAPGPLPPQRAGVRALSGLGLAVHQVVCENPADHKSDRLGQAAQRRSGLCWEA